jgi:glycine amidinotransferase
VTPTAEGEVAAAQATAVVNSHNEWDPLEEVIVGSLDGLAIPPWEPGLHAATPVDQLEEARTFHLVHGGQPLPAIELTAAQRELGEFVSILQGEGVVVRRPDPIPHDRPVMGQDWSSVSGNGHNNPRDVLIILGNEILEAPMAWRSRYFEHLAYRSLIKEYFRAGAQWTAAPKPAMSAAAYDLGYERGEGYVTTEFEPMFDAADMARCGRDIFIQRSQVTNDFGIEWLARHYGSKYRFHKIEFADPRAIHIDATFVPLAPGFIMINPDRPYKKVPEVLRDSSWTELTPPESTFPREHPSYSSLRWLSLNVLNLDERRIIVESHERPLIQAMKSWGFEPIPCPFRSNYRLGGSFHCSTVDIRRRGELRSYL